MSARLFLAAAAALIPIALSAPAPAHAQGSEGLLPALPAHAPPGVCYAHVRQGATFTPPGPAHARWTLRPGSPGPVWCLVSEPGTPPMRIREERDGWLRVRCDHRAPVRHIAARPHPRPHLAPPPPPPVIARAPCCIAPPAPVPVRSCCDLAGAPPPPPPVRTIFVQAPPPPRSPWLSWSGKSLY